MDCIKAEDSGGLSILEAMVINGKFMVQQVTGVQRCARELVRELDSLVKENEISLVVPNCDEVDLELRNIKIIKYGNAVTKKKGNALSYVWELINLSFYLIKNKALCINFGGTAPPFHVDFVVLHDINYKTHPQFFKGAGLFNRKLHCLSYWFACKFAKHIFAVSEYTGKMAIKHYKVRPERITVAGNGWQHYQRIDCDSSIYNCFPELTEQPFFFSLGSLDMHKNIPWIFEAARLNNRYKFCITGSESVNKAKFSDIPKNVIFTGRLNDSQVKTLMRDCTAFIFPSYCEGFGIPPMEALSVGTRIIVSNVSCLPEIYEDSAIYIDPSNPNVNMDELLKVKTSDPTRILDKYSWRKSAEAIYGVINMYSNIRVGE
jgi:glycosyltransferase involved in cell wall biosynthesis